MVVVCGAFKFHSGVISDNTILEGSWNKNAIGGIWGDKKDPDPYACFVNFPIARYFNWEFSVTLIYHFDVDVITFQIENDFIILFDAKEFSMGMGLKY